MPDSFFDRLKSALIDRVDAWFVETPAGLRQLVLALYAMVVPPFLAVLAVAAPAGSRLSATAAVAALCIAAVGAVWREPGRAAWIYAAGIAPVVSCGIAFVASGGSGPGFLAVIGAPVAWAAVLFDIRVAIAAWVATLLTATIAIGVVHGAWTAAASGLLVGVVQGLVAWVVFGKSWRHREARLRSLERQVNDIELVVRSSDGRIVGANDRAVSAYGYPKPILLTKNVRDIRRADADAVVAQMASVPEFDALVYRARHFRADGSWFPAEISSRRFTSNGVAYHHVLARDVTAQEEAAARLHEAVTQLSFVLEGTNDGFWDWHVPTGRVQFSRRWAAMLGYELQEIEPSLLSWERLVHPDDLQGIMAVLQPHLRGETPYYECEHRLRHKGGHWVWVLDRGKVVERDANGAAVRAAGTHTDISRRKEAEESLRQALADNERIVAELREALATVKTLSRFLPICSFCKKIRNDRGYWDEVEHYISTHTDSSFSHGVCPECLLKHYGEWAER